MSWKALAWAAKCHVQHSADKLVLLGLAERHNEESGTAYPSIDWLSEFGSLNRKTVITALNRLEAAGFIADSGDRKGRTLQVKAYALHTETVPKLEQSLNRNSTEKSPKQSQKRDTEPSKEPTTPVSSNELTSPKPVNGKPSVSVEQLGEAWNSIAVPSGAVECRRMGEERRRKAIPFLRRWPVDEITEAISAVARSDFLCGRGKDNFRADIEFLFSPKHMNRLLEGFYEH